MMRDKQLRLRLPRRRNAADGATYDFSYCFQTFLSYAPERAKQCLALAPMGGA